MEALVLAVPFEHASSVKTIDLGCRTGIVAEHVLTTLTEAAT